MNETVRLVRTGGLIVFVEISFPWPLIGVPEDKQRSIAPGFTKLSDYFSMYIADLRLRLGPDTERNRAIDTRGLDPQAGNRNIAAYLRDTGCCEDVVQIETYLPLWGWPTGKALICVSFPLNAIEPHMKKAG